MNIDQQQTATMGAGRRVEHIVRCESPKICTMPNDLAKLELASALFLQY